MVLLGCTFSELWVCEVQQPVQMRGKQLGHLVPAAAVKHV